jgi:hypothetical protein
MDDEAVNSSEEASPGSEVASNFACINPSSSHWGEQTPSPDGIREQQRPSFIMFMSNKTEGTVLYATPSVKVK